MIVGIYMYIADIYLLKNKETKIYMVVLWVRALAHLLLMSFYYLSCIAGSMRGLQQFYVRANGWSG